MLRKLRSRLTYANVMATLGVFLGLGGTAWAVAANSVGTTELKNGAVTNPKLAAKSVGTGKVFDGSLLAQDFKAGVLPKGADSFNNVHLNYDEGAVLARVGGVELEVGCNTNSAAGDIPLYVALAAGLNHVDVLGTVVHDHQFESPHVRKEVWVAQANNTLDIDVIASRVAPGAQFTLFRVSAGFGADGCNYGGMVLPASN